MRDVLVITQNGAGRVWRVPSLRAARLSPLVQTYDVVASCSEALLAQHGASRCEHLGRRAPQGPAGDRVRRLFADWAAAGGAPSREVLAAARDLWAMLLAEAAEPPLDAAALVAEIAADRLAMEGRSVQVVLDGLRRGATVTCNDDEQEENDVADRAPRIHDTTVIHMGKDEQGKKYGKDNNPKRQGTAAHSQFALHKDGVTVKQARDAGLTASNIAYDAKHGLIMLTPDAKAREAATAAKAAATKAAKKAPAKAA